MCGRRNCVCAVRAVRKCAAGRKRLGWECPGRRVSNQVRVGSNQARQVELGQPNGGGWVVVWWGNMRWWEQRHGRHGNPW